MDRGELAAFLGTGPAMLGASVVDDLTPEAFRVWGASVDDDGRIRALVTSDASRTFTSVQAGSRISLTFTDILTFRSVQVKGSATGSPEAPGPADAACLRSYHERFTQALTAVGHPASLTESLRPVASFVVSIEVDEVFDQTPGPSAGARVGALR